MNHPTTQPDNMSENTSDVETEDETGEEHEHHDSSGTTHEDYRWKGLSTTLALFLGLGFPIAVGLHAGGLLDITTVPQWAWLPITSGWLGILVYSFGENIKQAWKGEVN